MREARNPDVAVMVAVEGDRRGGETAAGRGAARGGPDSGAV